ncbi:hypothetical protein GCM10022393_22410 [Aquimarina addita]|uniref:Co-chaperone DjlA N-terminal domain-containing protein n=1 Tax=Aquimarina addita TaxID=870485 RepID=A0ABP6UM31_9FLAO
MYSKEEKLSLLSEMIEFARADNKVKEEEYGFILAVAEQLGITAHELGELMEKGVQKKSIHPESERILQFHRLVLLMNVDQESVPSELHKIRNMGLQMGLRPEAIDTVLKEMHSYPNKVIPPKELMAIFTKFYN